MFYGSGLSCYEFAENNLRMKEHHLNIERIIPAAKAPTERAKTGYEAIPLNSDTILNKPAAAIV